MDKTQKTEQEERFVSPYLNLPQRSLDEVIHERSSGQGHPLSDRQRRAAKFIEVVDADFA